MTKLLIFCLLPLILNASENRTNINRLTDPISSIIEYLPRKSRRESRFINQRFNHYYNKAYSNIRESIHNFTIYANEIVIDGVIKNETIDALKHIYNKFKFHKSYMEQWPKIVGQCVKRNSAALNKTWMNNLMLFLKTIHVRSWNKSALIEDVPSLLARVSHIIFDTMYFHKPGNLRWHLFLYQTMWIYLSVRNLLPPLASMYYLDANTEIYKQQISNLNQLHQEHGLIVWDPAFLRFKWEANGFYKYIHEYMHFKRLFNESNPEFLAYCQMQFVLKLLEDNKYDFTIVCRHEHELFPHFEAIIRETIHHLYTNTIWITLDEVLHALYKNNGLRLLDDDAFLVKLCVDSNVTETFIGILNALYNYQDSMEFLACSALAKSIYFWFVVEQPQDAMNELMYLSNDGLLEPDMLNSMIHFLGEPMFYFVTPEAEKQYLEMLFVEYRHQMIIRNISR